MVCIGLAVKLMGVDLDDDVYLRFKVFPFLSLLMLYASEKLKKQGTFNPVYLLLILPLIVVVIIELLLVASTYTKMFGFSTLNLTISYLLKFSNINKREKMAIIFIACLYIVARLRVHSLTNPESASVKDFFPLIGMLIVHHYNVDLDEEINKMLNTRFVSTQQKWLHSLQSMPIGVLIYNTAH